MRDAGLGSWPQRRARAARDVVALIHADRTETFGSLAERVRLLADGLQARGIRAGDRVAYLGRNHPAFVETFFAAAALGAVFVPLNTRLAAPEIAFLLEDSSPGLLIAAPEQADVAIAALTLTSADVAVMGVVVGHQEYERLVSSGIGDEQEREVSLDDLAMIMYTSGTTGRPKGVMLTHGNLTWNTFNLLADLDVTSRDVTLVSAPLFHTAALSQTFLPTFFKGATSVLAPTFDPDGTYDLIEVHRISFMFGVPTMFRALAASPRWADADLSSLRLLHCGGAPMPDGLVRTYRERGLDLVQGYGLTEAAPGVLLSRSDGRIEDGGAGTPCFFLDLRLVDATGRPADPGQPGEILVSGPNVMAGYWRRPEATSAALPDGMWLRTGDVGRAEPSGSIRIVDRVKDIFISGGENVSPAEVESVLAAHASVADCAVIGVPDETWGEVGRAIVVRREGADLDPAEVLLWLSERLARYKVPKSLVIVPSLPRNAAGKLLRGQLLRSDDPAS